MSKNTARAVSLDMLDAILGKGAYNNIIISQELNKYTDLEQREKAFATELTNGVLRNLTFLDYIIAQYSKTPIQKMKPLILNVLRQAVYQIIIINTADYAVCSEAVELVRMRGLKGLTGFVNGVLRSVVRGKDHLNLPSEQEAPSEYLSVVYSHPKWLINKWLKSYDYDFVKELCKKNNTAPKVSLRTNTLKLTSDALQAKLAESGAVLTTSPLDSEAIILRSGAALKELPSFRQGQFHVQDVASQLAVRVLDPRPGSVVVDLCAAPGGKSFTAAYLMENEGCIYARDVYTHKISLIEDGAKRLGIDIIQTEKRRAQMMDESLIGQADYVLVDAPCSGFGLLRKKPDIKINRTKKDIVQLQEIQRDILDVAEKYVRPGGVLVYSTCTLIPEENQENVQWFLDNYSFRQRDLAQDIAEGILSKRLRHDIKDGCLTLFPHIHDTDGFFISKFIKQDEPQNK